MLYPTQLAYYNDPYTTEFGSYVIETQRTGDRVAVYLDTTIFYPTGGGQPSDQGTIETETGAASVSDVRIVDGVVKHDCTMIMGHIEEDQDAKLILDWKRRYRNMRVHSAGHLIHDVLMELATGLIPIRGNHGSSPYLEYQTSQQVALDGLQDELNGRLNELIRVGRMVTTRETNLEELQQIARFIPNNLPKNKPLRVMQIEGFAAMPDGGTQVKNVKEILRICVTSIVEQGDILKVSYSVLDQ